MTKTNNLKIKLYVLRYLNKLLIEKLNNKIISSTCIDAIILNHNKIRVYNKRLYIIEQGNQYAIYDIKKKCLKSILVDKIDVIELSKNDYVIDFEVKNEENNKKIHGKMTEDGIIYVVWNKDGLISIENTKNLNKIINGGKKHESRNRSIQ